jgi:membrane-bound lytic murein transglycosylase B
MSTDPTSKIKKSFAIATLWLLVCMSFAQAQVSPEEKAKLEAELKALEAESARIQTQLTSKKGERASLERDLSIIAGKISASKNQIQKISLTINKLSGEIGDREDRIDDLNNKISKNRQYILDSLNELKKLDDIRTAVALSEDKTLSDVFVNRGDYRAVQDGLVQNVDNLRNNKKFVEVEKEVLEDKKDESEALKKRQEIEKQKVEAAKKEKNNLLVVTKGEEKQYSNALAEKQKQITAIKTRLFSLRDTGGITFDKAQKYAQAASKATGVRAALILAILKQESNLGSNVGRCYLSNASTGAGTNVNSGASLAKVMNPTRDVPVFLKLMSGLGRDPYKTRISCPVPGIGWGGAMGPTQFIPSTWVRYQSRVSSLTGSGGDPWSAYDAIFATALYLSDSGAAGGGYTAERNAACKYYSGRSCSSSSAGAGYGNSVMRHAENFQKDIDLLNE